MGTQFVVLDLSVATRGEKVLLSVARSDSSAVLRGLLTRDQALDLAQRLIREATRKAAE